ncbi:MAG: hypothetical protein ABL999_12320 [Pyrinomonadaceae bacterium]
MSKAADIYWDSPRRTAAKRPAPARNRRVTAVADRRTAPWWLSFLIVISIFVMICVSINFRAVSDVRAEADQNVVLNSKIQNLMDENLALQEEIHSLKTDPQVIQREAKRIGINIQSEKVPVPAN